MQKVQHKFMPEGCFINMYLNCIRKHGFKEIKELYEYVIRDISHNIDFYNIKFNIGNKNH